MPISPVHIQKRMMQLGRVRLGEKTASGAPKKLDTFRFTSASRSLLEAVAEIHGGQVTVWESAPDEGYFQVTTEATSLDIILPPVFSDVDGSPTLPYSQWFERWNAGGCERRCDGVTESITAKPCMCDPAKRKEGAASECKATTRVSFMLPDLPGLGVWRLDTHGWNAAVELPLTLEVLSSAAREHKFIPAVLSIQKRTKKEGGQTRRFVVPVIELKGATMKQLAAGEAPSLLALNGPVPAPPRPGLPSGGSILPDDPSFDGEQQPGFGAPPPLPGVAASTPAPEPQPAADDTDGPGVTPAQKKQLNILVGKLRESGHLTTEQLYARCQIEPIASDYDEAGDLHWSPLRDRLSKSYASGLIEALKKFEASIEDGSYFERRAQQVREKVGERA